MSEPLIVLGAGSHSKIVISTARALGYVVEALFDDDPAKLGISIMGVPVRGCLQDIEHNPETAIWGIVAIGDNLVRQRVATQLGRVKWRTLIHPHSWVDLSTKVGVGTLICAGAILQPAVEIGNHCIVNTSASLDHDSKLGDYVHVAPGARVAGSVEVGEGTLLGMGCCILPNRRIGAYSVVGAGAVVTQDVPDRVVAAGVPARVIRSINDE